jgi:hypothetical protein
VSEQSIRNILFTDADVDGPAIKLAGEWDVEIVRAADVRLRTAPDPIIFEYALEHGYVVVTGNIQDYAPLVKAWLASGETHPGIICITKKHRTNSQYTLIAS